MKRHFKKSVALLLTLVLLFSVCVPAFAEDNEDVPQYENMLVFGDSITCAFGLPTCASFGVAEGSYSDIVAKAVGADPYTSLAFTGCCIAQVMYMVGLDIEVADVDDIKAFLGSMPGATSWEQYERVRNGESAAGDIEEAIKGSDLIVMAIGANDLGTVPFQRADSVYNAALDAGASRTEALQAFVDKYVDMLNMGLEYFLAGYPQILERIREINPDADIVLVSSYNPFINVKLTDKDMVAIGNALSPAVKLQNEQIKLWAKQYDCIYVDVYDMSYRFGETTIDVALENNALDTHPDYDGHAWMAEQILNALKTADEEQRSEGCQFVSDLAGGLGRLLSGVFRQPLIKMLDTVFDKIGSFADNIFAAILSFPYR